MGSQPSNGVVFEAWDVRDVALRATLYPRFAEVRLQREAGVTWLRLTGPEPLNAVGLVLEISHGVRITDRNQISEGQLEYGRYQLSVFDDYDECGSLLVDQVEIIEE